MTGKRRAMRQSVPAKAQRTEATRLHLAKHGEKIVVPKRRRRRNPTSNRIRKSRAPRYGSWKRRRRNSVKSSGAPMTRDPNTSPCAASRRSQSSTPPNSNDCCHPTPRSFRSFNSWKASMSKAWI